MHYILDNEGYVEEVSFGGIIECKNNTCSEYTGKVPTGYSSLEDWHFEADIRAYKVVDGDLVFDANRDYKLKIIYDQQKNDNSPITRKELGMASTEEINPYTDLFPSHKTSGGYIVSVNEKFNRVGNLPTEEVNLSALKEQDLDFIELEFIGNNFLPNTATSSVNNGIEYTQNKDKTINVSGTATDRSTLNLAGTDTSVRNILTFKANTSYLLSGLEGLSLEFYKYDGSDRTLVGIYKDGVISFEEDMNVTQVVLVVDKGTSIDTTIKPMLQLVSLEYPLLHMKKHHNPNVFDINKQTGSGFDISNLEIGKVYTISSKKPITWFKISDSPDGYNSIECFDENGFTKYTFIMKKNENIPSDITQLAFFSVNGTYTPLYDINILKDYGIQIEEGIIGRNGQYYIDGISTQKTKNSNQKIKRSGLATEHNNTEFWDTNETTLNSFIMPLEDGWARFKVNNTSSSLRIYNFVMKRMAFDLEPNTQYTLILEFRNIIGKNSSGFFNPIADNVNGSYFTSIRSIMISSITEGIQKHLLTSKSDLSQATQNSYLYLNARESCEFECRMSIVKGDYTSIEYTYEPYGISPSPDSPSEIINIYKAGTYNAIAGNKIYTFTLPEDLRSLPDGISDRLWIDADGDNGIDIERKVGSVVLDGVNYYFTNKDGTTYNNMFITNSLPNIKQVVNNNTLGNISSTYFKNEVTDILFMNDVIGIGSRADYHLSVGFGLSSKINSAELANQWLKENNVIVCYRLETYTTSFLPNFTLEKFEYEEYKNNTTLIDLAGNKLTISDEIIIKNNQIILMKENGTEVYLGDTVMPRTYTPYTHAYCHQKVFINFKYKDPRNVDITKINLKGLISITDVETEYNFCEEDLTRIRNYIMDTGTLTDEEFELYDVNGDGLIGASDYVLIKNMIDGVSSNKVTGTFEINTTQSKRVLVLRDSEGKILTSLGLNGIFTPSLSVNGGKVYGEHVLFNGETNGDVALNDDVINYDYIEIYYKNNGKTCDSTKIYQANDKAVKLTMEYIYTSGNFVYTENLFKSIYIKNNNIEIEGYGYLQTLDKEINNVNTTDNYIYITRVVGYKGNKSEVVEEDEPDTPVTPEEPTEDIIEVNKTSTITGSTSSSTWTFKTEATEVSVDKVNKTSIVTVTNYIGRPSDKGSSYFMGDLTINYACGDKTESETIYKNSGTISAGGWCKLGSRTFTIEHTEEPMIISVSGSMSTSAFNPSSASASGIITLTRI